MYAFQLVVSNVHYLRLDSFFCDFFDFPFFAYTFPLFMLKCAYPLRIGSSGERPGGFFAGQLFFFTVIFPGKKPKAATQRGFALPLSMRSIGVAHGSAKLRGL